ncbi:uncharacterized protein LOC131931290 [Physella acuta]|uniref:uncharacterized protein LOC131931290 n=1 Tax=Physella acuta TaxID=109671 RepID=UPI0027DEA87F|nr:uncharacterized protein LOC131931290 [Physella acuta]
MNETNSSDWQPTPEERDFFYKLYCVYISSDSLSFILGNIINVWLLIAILTSSEMRLMLRNKILVFVCICNVVESSILAPLEMSLNLELADSRNCITVELMFHLQSFLDFCSNWYLVIIFILYIIQIRDIDVSVYVNPTFHKIGPVLLMVSPMIIAILTVPVIMKVYHDEFLRLHKISYTCVFPTYSSLMIFKILDSVLPILTLIILLAIALYLRRQRLLIESSGGSMEVGLIKRTSPLDNVLPYVLAVAVTFLCNILDVTKSLGGEILIPIDLKVWYIFVTVNRFLLESRTYTVPLSWIFLKDIGERIKTWRPWYRPGPGIDLTVVYSKESA